MSTKSRIFYACQTVSMTSAVGLNPYDLDRYYSWVPGIQSVSVNTDFKLDPVFHFGQLGLYENLETVPDIQINMTKFLDGWPLLYHLAIGEGQLIELVNHRCGVRLGILEKETSTFGGYPSEFLTMKPCYLSNISYSLGVNEKFTETATLVGNSRSWDRSGGGFSSFPPGSITARPTGMGIAQKQHLDLTQTLLPTGYPTNRTPQLLDTRLVLTEDDLDEWHGGIIKDSHIQSINISVNIGREPIYHFGQLIPYSRPITFPVEVNCEISVIATDGDFIGYGDYNPTHKTTYNIYPCSNPQLLRPKAIKIVLCDGTTFDLGRNNKLKTISYKGDTGGGNTIATYSYTTYNDFTFKPKDPNRGTMNNVGVLGAPPSVPNTSDWFFYNPPTNIPNSF